MEYRITEEKKQILADMQVLYNQIGGKTEVTEDFNMMIESLSSAARRKAKLLIELYKKTLLLKSMRENPVVKCSFDAYNIVKPIMENLDHEESWAIYMNVGARVISVQNISKGGLTTTDVDIRIILHKALMCNATAIILSHNHPSGRTKPSLADDSLTKHLGESCKTMGIRLLDHIIYADDKFYSYGDEGRI